MSIVRIHSGYLLAPPGKRMLPFLSSTHGSSGAMFAGGASAAAGASAYAALTTAASGGGAAGLAAATLGGADAPEAAGAALLAGEAAGAACPRTLAVREARWSQKGKSGMPTASTACMYEFWMRCRMRESSSTFS